MNLPGHWPQFLWAYIGYSIFMGIFTNLVIVPIMTHLFSFVGWPSRVLQYPILLIISLVVGFFVFIFFVNHFIVRPFVTKESEES